MTPLGVLLALIVLSALVILHELGHFIAARISKVPVEEFGLGLPPRLFGKKIGETLWSINMFPFGGFVRPNEEVLNRRPLSVQAFITVAGVAVNFLVAWVILSIGFWVGMEPLLATQDDVLAALQNNQFLLELQTEPQEDSFWLSHAVTDGHWGAEVRPGDWLVAVDGEKLFWSDQWEKMTLDGGETLQFYRPLTQESFEIQDSLLDDAWMPDGVYVSFFDEASTAESAGLARGDRIVSVEGQTVQTPDDVLAATRTASTQVRYEIEHGSERMTLTIPLRDDGRVGVGLSQAYRSGDRTLFFQDFPYKYGGLEHVAYGWRSPWMAIEEIGRLSKLTVMGFAGLLHNFFMAEAVPAGVSGPVGIVEAASGSIQEGFASIFRLAALISLSLGVMNLLPIPALDGGRLFFLAVRAVFGKRRSSRFEVLAHSAGFVLLILLIIYLTVNDVSNLL